MTPLTELTNVIVESQSIKSRLLRVQESIEKTIRRTENDLLEEALKDLGYSLISTSYGSELIDSRVQSKETVLSPKLLMTALPVSKVSAKTTHAARKQIENILRHLSNKLLVIVGPCALHDPKAALDYAKYIRRWRNTYGDKLEIIMRAYVEKPRTELGWKGFIYDPLLDGSNDINLGLIATRMLACQITNLGVPIAIERLNALTPQYLNSLVAYDVIGARNTTDQKAREYASATSSPVGFKNTPEGSVEAAAQAIVAANGQHSFLGIDTHGATKQINSLGNSTGHVILRGATNGPNYESRYIEATKEILKRKNLLLSIVVDASHGNSQKQAKNQKLVIDSVVDQIKKGENSICGVMIESNLIAGNQKNINGKNLIYGQSIVDECVDVKETESMLLQLHNSVRNRNNKSSQKKNKALELH